LPSGIVPLQSWLGESHTTSYGDGGGAGSSAELTPHNTMLPIANIIRLNLFMIASITNVHIAFSFFVLLNSPLRSHDDVIEAVDRADAFEDAAAIGIIQDNASFR
jgi:hypothetical protein